MGKIRLLVYKNLTTFPTHIKQPVIPHLLFSWAENTPVV
jgi:hypothetical protein